MNLLERLKERVIPRDEGPIIRLLAERIKLKGRDKERLDFHLEKLLTSINENPCLNITQRMKFLGFFGDRMERARKKLLELSLIEEIELKEGRGRPSKYLLLTEKGREYIGRLGEKPIPLHGNLKHHCLILKLKREYEEHYSVELNKNIEGLIPDLWCENRDKGIVEVIDTNHVRRDMEKILKLHKHLDWIHLVFTSEQLMNHYKYTFESELPKKVLKKIQWFRES